MKLSNQALGAVMMALQKSILEQSDIVPVLTGFEFIDTKDGLMVENPPVVHFSNDDSDDEEDEESLGENA